MIRKRHTTMASATEQRIIKLAQELLLEEAETDTRHAHPDQRDHRSRRLVVSELAGRNQ